MRKIKYILQITSCQNNLQKIWIKWVGVLAGVLAGVLFYLLLSVDVFGQAVHINLNIRNKIVLSEQDPFMLKPSVDYTTNSKIMEGSCIFTFTGSDNLWVNASLPSFVVFRNDLGERVLCSTNLSFRNDGHSEYNGKDSGNMTTFPLSNPVKLSGRSQNSPLLYKAYLFVFIRTKLTDMASDSYSGDVLLNIEYN